VTCLAALKSAPTFSLAVQWYVILTGLSHLHVALVLVAPPKLVLLITVSPLLSKQDVAMHVELVPVLASGTKFGNPCGVAMELAEAGETAIAHQAVWKDCGHVHSGKEIKIEVLP
jgi:hypothetical protein